MIGAELRRRQPADDLAQCAVDGPPWLGEVELEDVNVVAEQADPGWGDRWPVHGV